MVGKHQFGFRGFGGRGFDNCDCFLFGLRSTQLGGLFQGCYGFLSLAVFLVAVTLVCLGASVTEWVEGFVFVVDFRKR